MITIKNTNPFINYFKKTNLTFWILSLIISIFSVTLLASVSRNDSTNYALRQAEAIIVGYLGAFLFTKINYQVVAKKWYITAGICLALLAYTIIFGEAVEGTDGVSAKAWIKLPGGVQFQPSELAKVGFIITFSQHLNYIKKNGHLKEFKHIFFLALHALVPMGLTQLQGDTGAAVIFFFMFLTMSFAAGVQLRYFGIILAAICIIIPLAWNLNILLTEYQKKRFLIQFDLESDPAEYGFQQIQGRTSIASGQLWGRGLFKGIRVGSGVVPIAQSDFIFSVVGEELGFLGCLLVIALLAGLIFTTLHIAKCSCDDLGKYMCFGFIGLVMFQTIFNLGMCLTVLPVMGVTLPFFSAGGSSAACLYFALGLIQNVYMSRDNKDLVILNEMEN